MVEECDTVSLEDKQSVTPKLQKNSEIGISLIVIRPSAYIPV